LIGLSSGKREPNKGSADAWEIMMLKTSESKVASLRVSCIAARRNRQGHVERWKQQVRSRLPARPPFLMERYVEASTFGPPSKPFRINDFLKEAGVFQTRNSSVLTTLKGDSDAMQVDSGEGDFEPIPENLKTTIASECRCA
jgi:hypothetical protein